ENSLVFIMVAMGIMNEKAALFSLIILAMIILFGAFGGIAYVVRPFFDSRIKNNMIEASKKEE
ncbi:MAG: hypothetical protein MUP02_02420, partial [Actinobacteria bacterium]|nr:hypothetical protein [Actinomycetota bacterium]